MAYTQNTQQTNGGSTTYSGATFISIYKPNGEGQCPQHGDNCPGVHNNQYQKAYDGNISAQVDESEIYRRPDKGIPILKAPAPNLSHVPRTSSGRGQTRSPYSRSPQTVGAPGANSHNHNSHNGTNGNKGLEELLNKTPILGSTGEATTSEYKNASIVREAYRGFQQTKEGKALSQQYGKVEFDGYTMMDMGKGVVAGVITYGNGKKILAVNSDPETSKIFKNPEQYKKQFLEAMTHEYLHAAPGRSQNERQNEGSTYKETAKFYEHQAHTAGSSLEQSLYHGIAGSQRDIASRALDHNGDYRSDLGVGSYSRPGGYSQGGAQNTRYAPANGY